MATGGPRRRSSDYHGHDEYLLKDDHFRFEDRISRELARLRREGGEDLDGIRREVKALSDRLLMVMGAIALLAFLLPLAAPFIRGFLGMVP